MNRRELLAASGFLSAAALAGCLAAPRAADGHPFRTVGLPGEPPGPDLDAAPDLDEEDLRPLVEGNTAFALALHRYLVDENGGSLFTSPYSISVALAMAYAGARGQTATEMAETLRYTLGDDVHRAFHGLQAELDARSTTVDPMADDEEDEEVDAFQLEVANALWADEQIAWDADYVDRLDTRYGAGLLPADFAGDPDGERARINAWVADVTEDRIDELLPAGSIDQSTVAVLTNAIYFLASWQHEFDPDETETDTFENEDGTTATVPFMQQELRTRYAEVDGAQAVELPYVGGEVSMVLIVPTEDPLVTFERALDADRLLGVFDELGDAAGTLAMPAFEIDTEVELGAVLAELGMPTPFTAGADFSGMVEGDESLMWIDEVYHEATITVDEAGTEAAAATAVPMVSSAPPDWGELRLDRPFLFCIRDRPTDAVLFLGRVASF